MTEEHSILNKERYSCIIIQKLMYANITKYEEPIRVESIKNYLMLSYHRLCEWQEIKIRKNCVWCITNIELNEKDYDILRKRGWWGGDDKYEIN